MLKTKKIILSTLVHTPYEKVYQHFDRNLFEALRPPFLGLTVERFDGCTVGDEIHLNIGMGPFKGQWISVITAEEKNEQHIYFIDEGRKLPFPLTFWHHKHLLMSQSEGTTCIIDEISYWAQNAFVTQMIYPVLYTQFALRQPIYRKIFN